MAESSRSLEFPLTDGIECHPAQGTVSSRHLSFYFSSMRKVLLVHTRALIPKTLTLGILPPSGPKHLAANLRSILSCILGHQKASRKASWYGGPYHS